MKESASVSFLYNTRLGHLLLKLMMQLRVDRVIVWFLRSRLSALLVPSFIRNNHIDLSQIAEDRFATYRDVFLRHKKEIVFDAEETHLVSPCDGYLSAYRIGKDGFLRIKGTRYHVNNFFPPRRWFELPHFFIPPDNSAVALVFRLAASDYHHYHYFDDCIQHVHYYTEGTLHSVQPAALRKYPVFATNRRSCSLLETAHFGSVVQIEVGAFVVGGIVNHYDNGIRMRGEEKGHFDLSGSTIVLLFEPDRIRLRKDWKEALLSGREVRVITGERIGSAKKR